MAGVAAVFGGDGPVGLRLRQVLLAVRRDDVAEGRRAQLQLQGPVAEQGVVIAMEKVEVLEPEPGPDRGAGGDAQGRRRLGRDGGLGDRVGRALRLLARADPQDDPLAAPLRLVGRRDHVAAGRQTRRAGDGHRRPPRQGMAGDPRVRHPALDPGQDLGRRHDHRRLALEAEPVIDLPAPLVLRDRALDDGQPAGVLPPRGGPAREQGDQDQSGMRRQQTVWMHGELLPPWDRARRPARRATRGLH